MGCKSFIELAVVKIDVKDGERIKSIESDQTDNWHTLYAEVFKEKLVKLNNYQVKLHIESNVKPAQAKCRNKHLKKAIELKASKEGYRKVDDEPTTWLSEIVV